jgi:DNA-binding transcriptional LysR family regulator
MTVVKAAEADLGAFSDGAAGSLRLGIYQSVGARVIPRLLPRYALDWPDARAAARGPGRRRAVRARGARRARPQLC